jgi:hypothetical protein
MATDPGLIRRCSTRNCAADGPVTDSIKNAVLNFSYFLLLFHFSHKNNIESTIDLEEGIPVLLDFFLLFSKSKYIFLMMSTALRHDLAFVSLL